MEIVEAKLCDLKDEAKLAFLELELVNVLLSESNPQVDVIIVVYLQFSTSPTLSLS